MGGFPDLVHLDECPEELKEYATDVWGEVYSIDQDCLTALDLLEGNGRHYTRRKVSTPWKNAWLYLYPSSAIDRMPIEALVHNGMWRPTETEQKFYEQSLKLDDDIPF
jgi:gamma-glutamylcyclotransferase (GGCT)/AIG2-like uncharacterized protein YtfP